MRVVNLSLLSGQPLWKEVLHRKYGNRINHLSNSNDIHWPSYASRWWMNIVTLEDSVGTNWFNGEVGRKV